MVSSNRVQAMIDRVQAKFDSGEIAKSKMDDLDKAMKTGFMDLVRYQDLQASAHARGLITTEEATQIYQLLGGEAPSESKWDKLTLAQKVTITQVMGELMGAKLKHVKRSPGKRPRGKSGPSGIKGVRG